MEINKLERNITNENVIETWEQRKLDKLENNFIEGISKYRKGGIIEMQDMATVDRIEGKYAVCELLDGSMKDIELKQFKEKVSEGDIFNIEVILKDGQQVINVVEKNVKEMELRRQKILEKLNNIKNK